MSHSEICDAVHMRCRITTSIFAYRFRGMTITATAAITRMGIVLLLRWNVNGMTSILGRGGGVRRKN